MTGMTNVTFPVRSMRRKALGANGELVVRVSRTSPRAARPKPSSKPPPMALVAVGKLRRGGEPPAGRRGHRGDAGPYRLPVDVNRAGAAQARAAAEFRAGHVQHVAQRPQQRRVVGDIEVAGLSVDVERDHGVLHCPGSGLYHTACATGNLLDDGVGLWQLTSNRDKCSD